MVLGAVFGFISVPCGWGAAYAATMTLTRRADVKIRGFPCKSMDIHTYIHRGIHTYIHRGIHTYIDRGIRT